MNKILKNKRIIAFILAFTISFSVVTDYKQKEAQAIAIIDDIFFWTIGALLIAATGVVIGSNSQIEYGRLFTTKWVNSGNSKEELLVKGIDGTIKGLFITAKLKQFIENFTFPTSVPSVDYNTVDAISGMSGYYDGAVYSNKYSVPNTVKNYFPDNYKFTINLPSSVVQIKFYNMNGGMSKTFNVLNSSFVNGKLRLSVRGYSSMSSTTAYFTFYDIYNTKISENEWYYFRDGYVDNITSFSKIIGIDINGKEVPLSFQEPLDYNISNIDSTTINKNLVQDLPNKGYLPLPTDAYLESSKGTTIPLEDVKPHVETIPLEGEKDKIGILNPDGSLVLDNTKDWDIPSTDTGTGEGTGILNGIKSFFSGLWDMLKALLNGILSALGSLGDLIKSLIDGLLSGLSSILSNILSSVSSLASAIVNGISGILEGLFVPTVSIDELFSVPAGSGFGAIVDLFNFNSIFDIKPLPYEFKTSLDIIDLTGSGSGKVWDIEINIFDNKVVKDNLSLFRNVLSYSLLISVIYFIVYHFLPKRDMD